MRPYDNRSRATLCSRRAFAASPRTGSSSVLCRYYARLPEGNVSLMSMLCDKDGNRLAHAWADLHVVRHQPFEDRLIACTGGVASGALHRHLSEHASRGHVSRLALLSQWNKHERCPTRALRQPSPGTRVLYIFADPMNVVAYFLQRTDGRNLLPSLRHHCEMMSCRLPEIEKLITEQNFTKEDVLCGLAGRREARGSAASGRHGTNAGACGDREGGVGGMGVVEGDDLLDLEGHFRSWWDHGNRKYDIMFARYETMVSVLCVRSCLSIGRAAGGSLSASIVTLPSPTSPFACLPARLSFQLSIDLSLISKKSCRRVQQPFSLAHR